MYVIMPCFNTEKEIHDLTEMAVESIRNAGNVKLIIVDNGSTYAVKALKNLADIYIRNETNLGYPKAVNQGLKKAKSKVICIANNDIRVPKGIFDLEKELLKHHKIGSLHFKMINYDQPFEFGNELFATGKERWCTSSFFFIKREAIPKGGYDENFGMGGYDDYDFWHRVRHLNGWQTAYTNVSAYQHFGSWTLSKVPESEKHEKNLKYFVKKWGEEPDKLFQKRYPEQWEINYLEGFE